jgi:hypothetical protein
MVKLYYDNLFKEPILNDEIHLGEVEVGKTVEKYVYIFNNSTGRLVNIKVGIVGKTPRGFVIKNIPDILEPGEYEIMKIIWSPPMTLKRGLSIALNITGREVYFS